MPGNEVGDRIHNFLGQESVSQGQHHSQVIDGGWPSLSNNLWVGNQRQVGGPLVSNLKNYNLQQLADIDRGQGGQSSSLQHGLTFNQAALRPEITKSQSQNQTLNVNGYIQAHPAFQARQAETNFLGVDTAPRSLSVLDSQIGNGPELVKKNSVRLESNESPVNYDFFGGQQQVSGQHLGMVHSVPRQQSGISDMQLLQQQAMLKQMREFQRQQLHKSQFQQQEARHGSSMNQATSMVKQGSGNLSQNPINGFPGHDASNYLWQAENMTANANWRQHSTPSVMQGSSSGFIFSPEQGQVRLMGLVPQQVDQSLYGVPISSTRGNPNQFSSVQMDKPSMQQISATGNSFPGNQYPMFQDQVGLQDATSVPRQGDQGKSIFAPASGQGLSGGLNLENLQQVNTLQRNAFMQEFSERQSLVCPSETSQEKSSMQPTRLQNVATLDPTEEKILFGSDDSVWDIFGRSTNMGSALDGTDSFGPFPSVQSGSWSALMQSAVAETSSGDVGLQDEWNGLGVRNIEPLSGNQQSSIVNDGSKQQLAWADNNFQPTPTMSTQSFPRPGDANMNREFSNVSGGQQLAVQASHEHTEKLRSDPSQRFVEQLSEERSKWLDRRPLQKPLAESSQLSGNVAHSSDSQLNMNSISGHQQGLPLYNFGGEPYSKPNGWSFIESTSLGDAAALKNQGNESSLQLSQGGDHNSAMHEEMGRGSKLWKIDSVPNANVESGNVKSTVGSPQLNKEDSDLNNAATVTDSRSTRAIKESNQQLPNIHNLNLWKNIESPLNSGLSRVSAKYQQHQDKIAQTVESSENNCFEKEAAEAHGLDNSNMKENSNDTFRLNASQHTSTSGMRENARLDGSDQRAGKQKSSASASRKPPVTRKFQYHPMGDIDVEMEPSYGSKHHPHPQSMTQQFSQGLKGHDQGYSGQSKIPGHGTGESLQNEKGHLPGLQGDPKSSDVVPSRSTSLGGAPATSASFDRSLGNYLPGKIAQTSQNMLELLQKVDQSRERGAGMHLSSSVHNQFSEVPEAQTFDGSLGHFQQNQASASQGFGLQLGPPSQRLSSTDHAVPSQCSAQTVNSLNLINASSEKGKKAHHSWLGPATPHESPHGEFRSSISGTSGQIINKGQQYANQANFSTALSSGFPHSRSPLQSQHVTSVGSQGVASESVKPNFSALASQSKHTDDSSERTQASQLGMASVHHMVKSAPDDNLTSTAEASQPCTNHNHARDSAQHFPVLEAMPASKPSESSQQGAFKISPNAWTSVSAQQNLSGGQPSKAPQNIFKTKLQSNNNSETTVSVSKKFDDQIIRRGSGQSEFDLSSAKPQGFVGEGQPAKVQQVLSDNDITQKAANISNLHEKEYVVKHLNDGSPMNPGTTQRDIEAFGRSLRPNNSMHQHYSLLHQVQAMKSTEIDPSNRSVKRFKGQDSRLDAGQVASPGGQQLSYGPSTMVSDASTNRTLVPSGDAKMLSFSSKLGDNRDTNASSDDMRAFSPNDIQNLSSSNSSAAIRGENSQVSPQMAPSWFDRYGAFKNGQMLPTNHAQNAAVMRTMEKPYIVGRPSDSLHALQSTEQASTVAASTQMDNVHQSSISMSMASEPIPSSHLPPITTENLVLVRPKKRKTATSELLPWHREVTQGSQRLQNISMAEAEWTRVANRLIEKVEDEAELFEDWPPMLRSKRRLILTTQLMQQLFHAPPRVLSADAMEHYESVAYVVARSGLGDACSTASISGTGSDNLVPPDSGNILSEKFKVLESESIGDQYILKAVEDFIGRVKKLENDLLRLDKRASILDLRVECQDLERFSVINRFARFHGRGQADGAESSSSDATATTQKPFPQRYVTALPIPRNLPDRVQCLSL